MKLISISLLVVSISSASTYGVAAGTGKLQLQSKCTKSDECRPGLQCDSLKKQCKRSLNQKCTWNGECADTLKCLNKKCSKPLKIDNNYGVLKLNDHCLVDAPGEGMSCEKGVICDVKQGNSCKRIQGQKCETGKSQCFTGLSCLNGKCSKKPAGTECEADSDCQVGFTCKSSGYSKSCQKSSY